jgi:hypothetical protein
VDLRHEPGERDRNGEIYEAAVCGLEVLRVR